MTGEPTAVPMDGPDEPSWVGAWTQEEGATRAREVFAAAFPGRSPDGTWSAPGRVNLIGEHTDYNGGLCLPIALPHRTYLALARRDDDVVRLASAQEPAGTPWEINLADVASGVVDGWGSYVVGVAWALREAGYAIGGFDAAIDSCVPFGAGLSSSAALECAAALALDAVFHLGLAGSEKDPDDRGRAVLAAACIRAENEIAGANTGGMDQAASLRAQPGHALLLDCLDGSVRQVPWDPAIAGLALLVIDTRAPHQLVDGQYAQRRATCELAASTLGMGTLREIDPAGLSHALLRLPDDVSRARVRHVVTEIARVESFVAVLDAGQAAGERSAIRALGPILDASHESLRVDYEVTCRELDRAVEVARASGALGARMTGGGFGGSAIALVPSDRVDTVARAVAEAFAEAGFAPPEFLVAQAS